MSDVAAPLDALDALLRDGAAALGLDVSPAQAGRLLDYVALLKKWNATFNLTAVRDARDMLVVHLLDSLSILPLLDALAPRILLDVGSGAGLPAVPLAICRPAWTVNAVDAVAKKIGFQRQAKAALGLANLRPHHVRVEALTLTERPDVIVSRAFASLASMVAAVERLATPATRLVAMKGAVPTVELGALPAGWVASAVQPLDVPFLGAERCAIVLQRA